MGVKDLPKLLKEGSEKTSFEDERFKNYFWGVDMSALLHRFLCTGDNCKIFFADADIRLNDAIQKIVDDITLIRDNSQHVVCVFDGYSYPAKKQTSKLRSTKCDDALTEIKQQLDKAEEMYDQNPVEALRIRTHQLNNTRACVFRRLNFTADVILELKKLDSVSVVIAPYEADHQLGYLCSNKKIDAVYTVDSDLYMYGARKLMFYDRNELLYQDFTDTTKHENFIKRTLDCEYFKTQTLDQQNKLIKRVIDEDHLVCYAILMGCDYISSAVRLHKERKKQYILYLQTRDDENPSLAYTIWLNNLAKIAQIPNTATARLSERDRNNYSQAFNNTYNRIISAPVFAYTDLNATVTDNSSVKLAPLCLQMDLLNNNNEKWIKELNFEGNTFNPSFFMDLNATCDEICYAEKIPDPGDVTMIGKTVEVKTKDLETREDTFSTNKDEWSVPREYLIHSSNQSALYYTNSVLKKYLEGGGMYNNNDLTEKQLIDLVKERFQLAATVEILMIRPPLGQVVREGWISTKCLVPREGEIHVSSCQSTIDYIRSEVETIDAAVIERMVFEACDINNRNKSLQRAIKLFANGHVLLHTLQVTPTYFVDEAGTQLDVQTLELKVAASQGANDLHRLRIVLRDNGDQPDYLMKPSGFDGCTCPSGLGGCSHLYAALGMMQIIQTDKDITYESMQQLMPQPCHTFQSVAVPLATALDIMKGKRKGRSESTGKKKEQKKKLQQHLATIQNMIQEEDYDNFNH